MNERTHPVTVAGAEEGLADLAHRVGRMRYDALAFFIRALSANLAEQAAGDRGRGRRQLGALLDQAASQSGDLQETIEKAWRLSRPYMADELSETPEIVAPDIPMPNIEIDMIGGNCPVQAEGTINGVPFYFRARGTKWELHVGPGACVMKAEWVMAEEYPGDRFAAGWMSEDEAREFIKKGAERWAASTTGQQPSYTAPATGEQCRICGRPLDDPADPVRSQDCGGDCLKCMATVGKDPECIARLADSEAAIEPVDKR